MNSNNLIVSTDKLVKCRELLCQLQWNERHAERNTRIAASKALWFGLELLEFEGLIRTIPSASYLREHPHILHQAWEDVVHSNMPDQHFSELDRLLYA